MELGAKFSFDTASYELSTRDKKLVYDPAEDTHILLDALAAEWPEIEERAPSVCVEVGCGCGIVACTISKHLKTRSFVIGVDINPTAVEVTKRNAEINNVGVDVVAADLLSPLVDRMKGSIDLLVFNPPYVPTDGFEEVMEIGILARSWCGGNAEGTAVLRRLLGDIPNLLSAKGVFYLVAIASNRIDDLLVFDHRLRGRVVAERKHGLERLYVLKFVRDDDRFSTYR